MAPLIVPLITSGLTGLGISAATAAFVAPILASATIIGISLGLSMLLAVKPTLPSPEDGRQTVKQPIPPRVSGFGRYRAGGAIMLEEHGDGGTALVVMAVHDGRIDAYEDWYLNDDAVTLESSGAGPGVLNGTDGRYGVNQVKLYWTMGLASETAIAAITALTSQWTSSHRGDGIAAVGMVLEKPSANNYSKDFPYGIPLVSSVIRAQRVYDPRDGAQTQGTKTSYVWSRNIALELLAYLTDATGGMGLDYATHILPAVAMWKDAADVCDQAVALKAGGTAPRYVGGGSYRHESDPADVIATMLASMDGWMAVRGDGAIVIRAGKYETPSVTITADMILEYSVSNGVADEDIVNQLVIKYADSTLDYQMVEGDPWNGTGWDDILRSQTMELPWVHAHAQARRLAKREMLRQQAQWRGSVTVDLFGCVAIGERFVNLEIPEIATLTVEIRSMSLDLANARASIEWIEADPAMDDWDAASEEGTAPTVPGRPTPDTLDPPTWSLSAETKRITNKEDGVILHAVIDTAGRSDFGYAMRWRDSDTDGSGGNGPWTVAIDMDPDIDGSGLVDMLSPPVRTGTTYDVEVATRSGTDQSGWSSISSVSTVPSDVAPAAPTGLTVTSPAAGTAKVSWTNPDSANLDRIRVYRNTSNTFGSASVVATVFASGPNSDQKTTISGMVTGSTRWFWVTALNANGDESSAAGGVSVVIS